MINVEFKESKTRNGAISLHVTGHAGAGQVGQDIICSSATILAYTLAQLIMNYEKEVPDAFVKKPEVKLAVGDSLVKCHPATKTARAVITPMFLFTQTGYQLLAHNYSEYVTVDQTIGM